MPDSQPSSFTLSVLSPADVDRAADVCSEWQRRVEASQSLYRLYQSQLWWEHVRRTEGDDLLRLFVVRDGDGHICALAPSLLTTHTSVHDVRGRQITVLKARGLELLGSEPLADARPAVLAILFRGLCHAVPGASICRLKSLPAHSPAWEFLTSQEAADASYFVQTAGPKRRFYSIEMKDSWAAYLDRFTPKQRSDLKRKQRVLSEAAGALRVERIASEAMIERTYPDLQRCFDEAWTRTGKGLPSRSKLADAARSGFLRAYLMYAGDHAIAYAIGYQAHGVFHYSDVGFSMKYLKWSPGTVLLFMITRDLADHEPVPWINFGFGSAEYKRRFSNVTTEDGTVYVMRRSLRNRARAAAIGLVNFAWDFRQRRRVPEDVLPKSPVVAVAPAPADAE